MIIRSSMYIAGGLIAAFAAVSFYERSAFEAQMRRQLAQFPYQSIESRACRQQVVPARQCLSPGNLARLMYRP